MDNIAFKQTYPNAIHIFDESKQSQSKLRLLKMVWQQLPTYVQKKHPRQKIWLNTSDKVKQK